MKWNNIKEWMPDKIHKGEIFLVCDEHGIISIREYRVSKSRSGFDGWGSSLTTHWMPLPKPPEATVGE